MSVAESPLRLPTRKAKALLCYLALPAGRAHGRGHLCGLLWGESDEPRARNSLRQALFSLRRLLPRAPALCSNAQEVWLDPATTSTDVARLEAAAALSAEDAVSLLTQLREGELLAGFGVDEEGFEDWLRAERERLRLLQVEQLARLAAHFEQRGQLAEAAAGWARVLRLEPWGEAHHRALMTLYARMGRRTALLRQYQDCVAALRRELGADPSPATRALYERWVTPSPTLPTSLAPAQPLIGRATELAQLRALWTRAEGGCGGVVIIEGDPGVGKSALARALCTDLPGGSALTGRSFESEQVLALAPWADCIRSTPEIFGDAFWSSLPVPAQQAALALVPANAPAAQSSPGSATTSKPADGERLRHLFEGFEALLRSLSRRAPLLVVLDDIQWADDLSLRLLSFLGRHLVDGDRTLIVATLRSEDSDRPAVLSPTRHELRGSGRLTELTLSPLSRQATGELASALGWPAQAGRAQSLEERLWRLSEGNPFVITEAMRQIAQGEADPDLALPMPATVREMVLRHLERLESEDRSLVSLSAVLGRELDLTLVESLWSARGRSAMDLPGAIERLVRAGIFACSDDRCYFTHDRIREVAYGALLAPQRRALHRDVATALADGGGRPAQAAYHFARASAPAAAVACLLQLAEDAARRFGLDEAIAALDQAAALVPAAEPSCRPDLRVRIATRRSGYLGYLGRLGEVEACLLRERDQLEQLSDISLKAVYFTALGYTHSLAGHAAAAAAAGEQALEAAIGAEDRRSERRARSLLAYEAAHSGRYARGIELGDSAVGIALVPETDAEHAVLACCGLALNQLHSGDCQGALESLRLGEKRGEAGRVTRERAFASAFIALTHASMGEHGLATRACERALSLASDVMSRSLAATQHLFVHVMAGEGAASFRCNGADLASLIQQVEAAGNRHGLGLVLLYAARAQLQDGARAAALEHAARAKGLFEVAGDPRGVALAAVTEGLALGRAGGGAARVGSAIEALEGLGARLDWADTQLAMAQLVATADAQRHRLAAVARYRELDLPQRAAVAERATSTPADL